MIQIDRSEPAPSSLDAEKGWRGADVLERLHEDFLGKCYLCERRVEPTAFEVDHRVQRHWSSGEGREHAWSNLFPACEDCNKRRPKSEPPSGLLDPCTDALAERLHQAWTRHAPVFEPIDTSDQAAMATVKELDHLHLDGPKGANLRSAIQRAILDVITAERDLIDAGEGPQAERRAALRRLVSRRAPFTAMVRSVVLPGHRALFD